MKATTRGFCIGAWLGIGAVLAGCLPPADSPAQPPAAATPYSAAPQPAAPSQPATAHEQTDPSAPAPRVDPPQPPRKEAAEPPTRTGGEPRVIERSRKGTGLLVFSPDGKTILLDGNNDSVELWDVQTAKLQSTLGGHSRDIRCAGFSPDGKVLAVGSFNQIKLWDVPIAKEFQTLKGIDAQFYFTRFTPDGTKLVSGSFDSVGRQWDVGTGKESASARDMPSNCQNSALSPDGKTLALWGGSYAILLDTATLERQQKLESFAEFFQAVAFSADGKSLLAGCADKLKLFDLATGKTRVLHGNHTDWVTSVSLTEDGRLAASGSKDKTALLWDVKAGKEVAEIKGYSQPVRVRFFPDGKTLAT